MGRKRKVKKPIDPNTPICCICKKYIKKKRIVKIGENLVGFKVYRHDSCYLHNLSDKEVEHIKRCKKIKVKDLYKCV